MSTSAAGLSYALELRRDLSARNLPYARKHALPHCPSYGEVPAVCYEPYDDGGQPRHGNFLPLTYAAILANENWCRRLLKPHSQARRALPNNGRRWMELDSSHSSDALLMNVFCYPRVFAGGRVAAALGLNSTELPVLEFGVKARVPLAGGRFDRTEIDMRITTLLVEAKLTESDFQTKAKEVVEGYRDFAQVFDRRALPQTREVYLSYQLIRNVLAAAATGSAFCVLCDARRPDLIEAWYAVMRCVRAAELRTRCKVLTWQELAHSVPPRLQQFLEEKYGIKGCHRI